MYVNNCIATKNLARVPFSYASSAVRRRRKLRAAAHTLAAVWLKSTTRSAGVIRKVSNLFSYRHKLVISGT